MVAYKERAPGVYRARFVGIDTSFTFVDKATGEDVTRWKWTWQEIGDDTTVGELDTVTSAGFKSRSNGLKLFTGMLGRAPTEADDTDALVGQEFDVVYGPNQNGRYTVTGATRPAKFDNNQPQPVPTVAAVSAAHQAPPGELPF